MADFQFIDLKPDTASFREDMLHALTSPVKAIPPKHLYDETGARLFEAITRTPEYYPTRVEFSILDERAAELGELLGEHPVLFELGSGSSRKTRVLLSHLRGGGTYVPVDISRSMLSEAASCLAREFPTIEVAAVCADYASREALAVELPRRFRESAGSFGRPRALFFPGSSYGNFEPDEGRSFLVDAGRLLAPGGHLVIGLDLIKDRDTLEAAYNDAEGLTAAFNLNLLDRANRELGADFDLAQFRHLAFFNERSERIEMHLEAMKRQHVTLPGIDHPILFEEGETLHTENSYKYTLGQIERLAVEAGYAPRELWTDPGRNFCLAVLRWEGARDVRKVA